MPFMRQLSYLGLTFVLCNVLVSAETLTVSGKGQTPIPVAKQKDKLSRIRCSGIAETRLTRESYEQEASNHDSISEY